MTRPFARTQTSIARRTDPESSHRAAEEMTRSGARRTHAEQILSYIKSVGGETSAEIADALRMDRVEVARRLPDLRRVKLAKNGPQRKCRRTKRLSLTWWPVIRDPDAEMQGRLF